MSWSDARRTFEEQIPGFRERKSQSDLAQTVEQAFTTGVPLLAQAPPGTGKSYVAIVTLRDRARETGQGGVVSTGTKALQDQYIADCERIKSVYDPDLRYVVVKGRGNYLCRSKMSKADEVLLGVDLEELTRQAEKDEINGDVERLDIGLTPVQRRELTVTSDECPGKSKCKFGSVCFAERAKAKAETADVIIVSHALLATDASMKADGVSLLPMYPALIVDEAHDLRGYVEGALSTEVTQRSITQLISEVVNFTNETELVGEGEEASRKLFSRFEAVLGRERQKLLTPALVLELGGQLASLVEFVDTLDAKVAVVQVYDDDETTRKNRLRKRCASMANKLRKIIVDDFAHTVRWIERDEPNDRGHSRGILLCTGPLDVSEFLANAIWAYTTPVLMSATLAITDFKTGRTDFDFMAKEQGLDLTGNYKTFVGPTPFDFRTQARTYIPEHMPSLRDTPESWRSQFVFENQELIRAADGRSMLLFTSWRELNECYKLLAPYIQGELGHQVFKQGDMGSTRKLAQAFTDDEHSVLFGTKSFFTGVNVEGDSLRYLGIAKLPFHYPDPLWQARIDAINAPVPDHQRGFKGAFPNLQLPDMIMTLIQGYGRLIRTVSDRGLVAIFDPSITLSTGKSYGKNKVRPALPPAPILTDLRPAVDYLLSLDAPLTV